MTMKRKNNIVISHKKNIYPLVLLGCFLTIIFIGCTKDFEKDNTNPGALSPEQAVSISATAVGPMEQNIFSNYQISQNLSADAFCGYFMCPDNFAGGLNNLHYYLKDNWNASGFNDQYKLIMAPFSKLLSAGLKNTSPQVWAVLMLVQIDAMGRVTDRFGPIPYTQAGSSISNIPYDDQKSLYMTFFSQLDTIVSALHTYISGPDSSVNDFGGYDLVYGGNYKKWLKFANSLRLRYAIRISNVDPTDAQQQGEKALTDPGGFLENPGYPNGDDAMVAQSGTRSNDLYVISTYGSDLGLGAVLGTYLTGYNDPRTPVYSIPATYPTINGKTVGLRLGADVTVASSAPYNDGKHNYTNNVLANYNYLNTFTKLAPQPIMVAAEVWFLRAEAALRGWNGLTANDAKTFYETGIQTSMKQWGVSIGNYLSDNKSVPANYTDPINNANNINALATTTIMWDAGATKEQMLEKIITQKWLALFPEGQEAWAEYRRTGYPKQFPVVQNLSEGSFNGTNGGPITGDVRRIPYPVAEYQSNKAAVTAAVAALGGKDDGNTRLWWDTGKPNF